MKKIECYIKPEAVDAITQALRCEGVVGMSVSEVRGFGLESLSSATEERDWCRVGMSPGMKLELVVEKQYVDDLVDLISKALRGVGMPGGRVFVTPVDDAFSARTGIRGIESISIGWRR